MSDETDFQKLVELCLRTHEELQRRSGRVIDSHLALRNFLFGWYIVEFEQHGKERADYGKNILSQLSLKLKTALGRGFSVDTLENMRRFFLAYRPSLLAGEKSETPSRISFPQISETVSRIFNPADSAIHPRRSVESFPLPPATLGALASRFTLGWSHYVSLLTIDDPEERSFYEIEAGQNQWSVRELERQIASSLYQRLALSRDEDEIRKLAREGQIVEKAADLIKNPLVLEFLGLEEKPAYSESELETAIIDQLESFLLELGKGFLFEARQKRFTFDNDHFFVDLVFYNRLLRCYVLIDLKRDKLTHEDLGQMQMYVNYFDRHVKTEDELPTIGIVLCRRKNDALVELTLPEEANIFAPKYQLYLPSKEELKHKLETITAELEAGLDSRNSK